MTSTQSGLNLEGNPATAPIAPVLTITDGKLSLRKSRTLYFMEQFGMCVQNLE